MMMIVMPITMMTIIIMITIMIITISIRTIMIIMTIISMIIITITIIIMIIRKLHLSPQLGVVELELEFQDGSNRNFLASPVQVSEESRYCKHSNVQTDRHTH